MATDQIFADALEYPAGASLGPEHQQLQRLFRHLACDADGVGGQAAAQWISGVEQADPLPLARDDRQGECHGRIGGVEDQQDRGVGCLTQDATGLGAPIDDEAEAAEILPLPSPAECSNDFAQAGYAKPQTITL